MPKLQAMWTLADSTVWSTNERKIDLSRQFELEVCTVDMRVISTNCHVATELDIATDNTNVLHSSWEVKTGSDSQSTRLPKITSNGELI